MINRVVEQNLSKTRFTATIWVLSVRLALVLAISLAVLYYLVVRPTGKNQGQSRLGETPEMMIHVSQIDSYLCSLPTVQLLFLPSRWASSRTNSFPIQFVPNDTWTSLASHPFFITQCICSHTSICIRLCSEHTSEIDKSSAWAGPRRPTHTHSHHIGLIIIPMKSNRTDWRRGSSDSSLRMYIAKQLVSGCNPACQPRVGHWSYAPLLMHLQTSFVVTCTEYSQ